MDEIFLDKRSIDSSKLIVIPQGPQFRAKGGTFVAFVFINFMLFFLVFLFKGEFLASLIALFLAAILFFYFIDIRGIEFNPKDRLVRQYKSYLWFKFGNWDEISNYTQIHLVHSNYLGTSDFFGMRKPPTFHFYKIYLENSENKKVIFLSEYKNYYQAERICKNIAHLTGLRLKIF